MGRSEAAHYVREANGMVKATYTCPCHGVTFDSRLALRLHATQLRKRIQSDFAALVQEGGLGTLQAWERLPGESPVQFNKFKTYISSTDAKGQRSIYRTANILGMHSQNVKRISSRWHWPIRASLLDQHVEALEMAEFIVEKKKSARRQATLGKRLQEVANGAINRLLADDDRMNEISAHEIAKLADFGVKIERLANNDPTQIDSDKTVRIVWEGPKPDWAPDESPLALEAKNHRVLEGQK